MPSSPTGRVKALLESVAADVDRLPATALREIYPALVAAEKETAQALTRWLSDNKDGSARYTAHRHRQLLIQLRTARTQALKILRNQPGWTKDLESSLNRGLGKARTASGQLATTHIKQELATFDATFGHGLTPIDLDQAAVMARGENTLIQRHASSARRYSGKVWDDMRSQLTIGLLRNETVDQLTTRLQRMGGPPIAGAPGEAAAQGLFRRYRHWAERVVRTEVIHSYNTMAHEGLKEAQTVEPGLKRRWDSSMDVRLCIQCATLHGQVVDIDKPFSGGVMYPPAHPNCRCAVVAWHKDWAGDFSTEQSQRMREIEEDKRREQMLKDAQRAQLQEAQRKRREGLARAAEAKRAAAKQAAEAKRTEAQRRAAAKAAAAKARAERAAAKAEPGPISALKPFASSPDLKAWTQSDFESDNVAVAEAVFSKARVALEKDFARRGMIKQGENRRVVIRRDMKDRGQKSWTCEVHLHSDTADEANRFAQFVSDPENRAKLRRFYELRQQRLELARFPKATVLEESKALKEEASLLLPQVNKIMSDQPGYKALIHETLHGYGPVRAQAYVYHGVLVEEVTTEMMARGEMRSSFGVPLKEGGAYAKWIRPHIEYVQSRSIRLSQEDAYEVVLGASRRFRMRQDAFDNPVKARRAFASYLAAELGEKSDSLQESYKALCVRLADTAPD
jgi:SPP1 gp7 family putative phage head morphogenesis protein